MEVAVDPELAFEHWRAQCDLLVTHRYTVGIDDLPDACWRDYYEDGLRPVEAVDTAAEDVWHDDLP